LYQKCALKIIYNDFTSHDNVHTFNCIRADLPQLAYRHESLLGASLSRWRTLITAWIVYHSLHSCCKGDSPCQCNTTIFRPSEIRNPGTDRH